MTDKRKISEIYNETIQAINKLEPNLDSEEYKKLIEIIYKNRKLLGVNFNPRIMTHERIKELPTDIHDNIKMVVLNRGFLITSLHELKELLKEESSFLEQFNFK